MNAPFTIGWMVGAAHALIVAGLAGIFIAAKFKCQLRREREQHDLQRATDRKVALASMAGQPLAFATCDELLGEIERRQLPRIVFISSDDRRTRMSIACSREGLKVAIRECRTMLKGASH